MKERSGKAAKLCSSAAQAAYRGMGGEVMPLNQRAKFLEDIVSRLCRSRP